jgi:hypothetical protein
MKRSAPDGNEKPTEKLFFLDYKRPAGSSFKEKKAFEGGLVMHSWIRQTKICTIFTIINLQK